MSRPALLLERELHRISRTDESARPWGITAEVVLNDIFDWKCTILGPRDSVWEGGIFKVRMTFSEDYNQVPPKVVFETVPFHPNIDMHTGIPCIDFLDDSSAWKPNLTVYGMLLSLQNLILNPNLENPVNAPAAEIYSQSPRLYEQLCRDCVVASRRIEAGLRPHSTTFSDTRRQQNGRPKPNIISLHDDTSEYATRPHSAEVTTPQKQQPEPQQQPKPKVARLSFEEYHSYWKNAATALPPEPARLDSFKPIALRLDGVTENSRMTQTRFRDLVESQRYLWYGRFDIKNGKDRVKEATKKMLAVTKAYTAVASVELPMPDVTAETPLVASTPLPPGKMEDDLFALPNLPGKERNGFGGSVDPSVGMSVSENGKSVGLTSIMSSSRHVSVLSTVDAVGNEEGDWEKEAMELEQWANELQ